MSRSLRSARVIAAAWFVAATCGDIESRYGEAAVRGVTVRRALLVGIDRYEPPDGAASPGSSGRSAWTDLDGAVNDVEAMAEVLVSRYGFERDQVLILRDAGASRERILSSFRDHLIEPAKQGDDILFYFAGHGSRVRNSASEEDDRMDETIVPSDSYRGARDIRDKELRTLLNDALDRGARVTAVLDSCHSGSGTRAFAPPKHRSLPPDLRDVAELVREGPKDPRGPPAARGALVITAAQDYQLAHETTDAQGRQRGAFSYALQRVLSSVPPGEPVQRIFQRVLALLNNWAVNQTPVLSGPADRREAALFVTGAEEDSAFTTLAVQQVEDDRVTLSGGIATGIGPGSELVGIDAGGASAPRLRIEQVPDLTRSIARVIQAGATPIAPGQLFRVDRWSAPPAARLPVAIPAEAPSADWLRDTLQRLSPLRTSAKLEWIDDPAVETPTHVAWWSGESWELSSSAHARLALGRDPSPQEIIDAIGSRSGVRLFIALPPPPGVLAELGLEDAGVLRRVRDPSTARYVLVGRAQDGRVGYAWLQPDVFAPDATLRSPLPRATRWIDLPTGPSGAKDVGRGVRELAHRLARVWRWLELQSPPQDAAFPYRLVLRREPDRTPHAQGPLYEGELYTLALKRTPQGLQARSSPRWIYVFAIDSQMRSTLLFPRAELGDLENRYPPKSTGEDAAAFQSLVDLPGTRLRITEPFGTDTYVLLSTDQKIGDLTVFDSRAVRGTPTDGPRSGLEELLASTGQGRRGVEPEPIVTPTSWSIEQLAVETARGPRP